MTPQLLKRLLDACFYGKRVTELMPPLPKGMKPRHIHVIDAIKSLKAKNGQVHVSDVSKELRITMPSVTKLVNELSKGCIVEKREDEGDRRAVTLSLTSAGEALYRKYVSDFQYGLSRMLHDLDENECEATIRILGKMYEVMKDGKIRL